MKRSWEEQRIDKLLNTIRINTDARSLLLCVPVTRNLSVTTIRLSFASVCLSGKRQRLERTQKQDRECRNPYDIE